MFYLRLSDLLPLVDSGSLWPCDGKAVLKHSHSRRSAFTQAIVPQTVNLPSIIDRAPSDRTSSSPHTQYLVRPQFAEIREVRVKVPF